MGSHHRFAGKSIWWAAMLGLSLGMLIPTGAAFASSLKVPTHNAVRIPTLQARVSITAGPTRLKHYRLASSYFFAPNGEQSAGTAVCPTGTVVLGGGAVYLGEPSLSANINSSWPESDTTWEADLDNGSGSELEYQVFAICADTPLDYAIVSSASVSNPAGTDSTAYAQCHGATSILGGGGISSSYDTSVNMESSFPVQSLYPTSYRWQLNMNNDSGQDASEAAYAICGKVRGYQYVVGSEGTSPAGQQATDYADCPSGTFVTDGGVEVIYDAITGVLQVNIGGEDADNDLYSAWINYVNNASPSSAEGVYPYELCADT
jgi:hypothetical protein